MAANPLSSSGQHEGIEQFVSEEALREFSGRQQAVHDTARHYGLGPDNSLAIGGGALAAHGIDTYVSVAGEEPFDLDVLALQEVRYRRGVHAILRCLVVPEVEVFRDEAPLNLTVIRGTKAEKFSQTLGYPNFEDMVDSRIVTDNVATLPVGVLVREKLEAGRIKGYAGLVKAHRVASEVEHPILAAPYWSPTVSEAMRRLQQTPASEIQRLPQGLANFVKDDFDHPAYKNVRRN